MPDEPTTTEGDRQRREPDADALGHCRVCGKIADHVHNEVRDPEPKSHVEVAAAEKAEERNAARRARAAEQRAADQGPPDEADDDLVIDVELDPKLIQAAQQAQDAEKQDEGEAHKAEVAHQRAEESPVVDEVPDQGVRPQRGRPRARKDTEK